MAKKLLTFRDFDENEVIERVVVDGDFLDQDPAFLAMLREQELSVESEVIHDLSEKGQNTAAIIHNLIKRGV